MFQSSIPNPQRLFINGTGNAAAQVLIAAVPGKRIRGYGLFLSGGAAGQAKFQDTTPADISGLLFIGNLSQTVLPVIEAGVPWFETGVGLGLNIVVTNAVAYSGQLLYAVEA
jgi:hypothetical protein